MLVEEVEQQGGEYHNAGEKAQFPLVRQTAPLAL